METMQALNINKRCSEINKVNNPIRIATGIKLSNQLPVMRNFFQLLYSLYCGKKYQFA